MSIKSIYSTDFPSMELNIKADLNKISWVQSIPFITMHLIAVVGIFFVPFSLKYLTLAIGMYYLRMFGITAGYHRYFSHRTYKTSRVFQFILAFIGSASAQKGVLWWAAHHRDHHRDSDTVKDIHSPKQQGFLWAHVGWILCKKYDETEFKNVRDLVKFPELVWLNKYHLMPVVFLALVLFLSGGVNALFWGFVVSTVFLWHGTFAVNSLTHLFGRRRYQTSDDSRNSFLIALITMGEGWHNNHHHYMHTANQGFFWWEIDPSFYILKILSYLGLVWSLKTPSREILIRKNLN